jgi:hypothetical protein
VVAWVTIIDETFDVVALALLAMGRSLALEQTSRMTTSALAPTLARTLTRESHPAAAAVAARAPRHAARPLAAALFLEAAMALAFTVAVASLAGSMAEADAIGLRMVAGASLVVAIFAWSLARRGAMMNRAGSYTAAALLQVAVSVGIALIGLAAAEPTLFAILLPAPIVTMLALCLPSVREALDQV